MSLATPVGDPIAIFFLAIVAFLVAPAVLDYARLPGIVGIILAGAVVGPNGLAILERGETVVLLGEVGLLYLLFLAGLEIDVARFVESRSRSVAFGLLSFLVPQAVGTVAGVALFGMSLPGAALFASIFASHTLLAYPVASRLGLADRESVVATIGGTVVTDTIALLLLAVVVAADAGTLGLAFWLRLGVGVAGFFAVVWLAVPRLSRAFFARGGREGVSDYLFVLAVVFGSALLAEVVGIEPIVGAFLGGLAINRQIPHRGPLMNRIEFVGNALFIPFFLLSIGMLVDVRVLVAGSETLLLAAFLIVATLATKWAAAWIAGAAFGYSSAERMTMFGLSLGQAAAALAIVLVGVRIELFDDAVLNATVLLILAMSVVSPTVVDRYGREMAGEGGPAGDRTPTAGDRLLLALSPSADHAEGLVELALSLRDPGGTLSALTVVPPGRSVERNVEAASEALEDVADHAAAADAPMGTRTRVDHGVPAGLERAAVEDRASAILVGWDGRAGRRRTIGRTVDRLLAGSDRQVVVARVREPIAATAAVTVVLPAGIEGEWGFPAAARSAKRIAAAANAPVSVLLVGGESGLEPFERVDPELPAAFERVGWDDLPEALGEDGERTTVLLSPRPGAPGWSSELEALPATIATRSGNLAVVYPARRERDDRRFFELR
ncbi:cation:proton antiporter [Saliphagus sp. LR7]|uniref:cation:proton antiporter n=1 Tax=Saliphagus sp. LR7 TaxID=2282654 RepID=UPI000DF80764|nr:cation:proton antiporter [Saliphagus sp. LR7]